MFNRLVQLMALVLLGTSIIHAAEKVEAALGVHYTQVSPDARSDTPKVIEFFNYGCGACYQMEAFLDQWKKDKPEEIDFTRSSVDLRKDWAIYTKAFYIGELLGVLDQSHMAMFKQVHEQRKPVRNDAELKAFFLKLGVEEQAYDDIVSSFTLDSKLRTAKNQAKKFAVGGTPTFIINDQYSTSGARAKSYEMLNYLLTELPLQ